MNERIKQLALECYSPYTNFDHEKFAELIVQECVLISRTSTDGFSAVRRMEERFGVEE